MSADLDPILSEDELTHDCEESSLECEHCGEMVDRLYVVDDEDRYVGYLGELNVCRECLNKHEQRRRGIQ